MLKTVKSKEKEFHQRNNYEIQRTQKKQNKEKFIFFKKNLLLMLIFECFNFQNAIFNFINILFA